MFIVDSQVHIWKEETPDHPWVPGARERIRLNGHPDRFGIMARVPQDKPEEGRALMREFATIETIKGIRLTFHRPIDRNWMIDGTCDWIWPYAEELDIKIMVHAPIWKAELARIAERHPGLKIIIDHMGIDARCVDDAIGRCVKETADLHVHQQARDVRAPVTAIGSHLLDRLAYVAEDVLVGEGMPRVAGKRRELDGHGVSWRDTIEQFTVHMGLADAQLDEVMGRSLCRVLGWPVPASVEA